MKVSLVLLALLAALCALAVAADGVAPKNPSDRFKITTKRTDDSVDVRADKHKAFITVKSPFGISQAVIEGREDDWPKVVVLRLHLKGLVELPGLQRQGHAGCCGVDSGGKDEGA